MNITRIEIVVGQYEDHVTLTTDTPGPYPTRRSNAEPFNTRKGNTLRVRFMTSGGKGAAYCRKHFPGVEIVDSRPCGECSGTGRKVYGDTSTWHGGIGGQTLTEDVCNRCWGSGDRANPGENLRLKAQRR